MTPREMSEYLKTRIASVRDDPSISATVKTYARAGLLPLFDDLAYAYYLAPDGAVHVTDALAPEAGLRALTDEGERVRVLRAAADDDPLLLGLLPARPEGFEDCASCGGSGRADAGNVTYPSARTICSSCAGLGWLPR